MATEFDKLCRSGFEFLSESAEQIQDRPKFALISFAAGMELIFKARLLREHWSLIVTSRLDKRAFQAGDFISVSAKDALERITSVLGDAIPKDALSAYLQVSKHRNYVVHFFHPLDDDKFRQHVAKDMCLGWHHLERQLRTWKQFDKFAKDRERIHRSMKKARMYLSAVFDAAKPEIDLLRKQGVKIANCAACAFEAAALTQIAGSVWKQDCKVCGTSTNRVEYECPECEIPHHFDGWNSFQATQCECGETITQEDVRAILTKTAPDDLDTAINCAECMSPNSAIPHGDRYLCLECATFGEIEHCDWCQEDQLGGGSLEFSGLSGCEFCDGRGMDD